MALAAGAAILAGCGVQPGDYVVYRVNLTEPHLSDGCYYPLDEPPPGVRESSSSYGTPSTWVLYFAGGERVVLDVVTASLAGEEADDGFAFVGYTVDTSYVGEDLQEAKITVATETTLTMAVDGSTIEGDIASRRTTRCELLMDNPPTVTCDDVPSCRQSQQFRGVELEDVDIESSVDRPNPV